MAVLITTPLVEFRYFIIPLLLINIEIRPKIEIQKNWFTFFDSFFWNMAIYLIINAATIYVFLLKPFECMGGEVCRFMW